MCESGVSVVVVREAECLFVDGESVALEELEGPL